MHIEFRNIHFTYEQRVIFKGLDARIEDAGFHSLFGPSGVGKTTLAKIIAGMQNGYSGEIETHDIDKILYTYNLERLPEWSTIGENFRRITPDGREALLGDIVTALGLDSHLDSRFSQLSLGQKNRANLTRYLTQDFDLLIMDESLANVDELTRETIILTIKDLFPDKIFLYISHNMIEVSRFCREILVFRSAAKVPQTLAVKGLDLRKGETFSRDGLDKVTMEIVHAS